MQLGLDGAAPPRLLPNPSELLAAYDQAAGPLRNARDIPDPRDAAAVDGFLAAIAAVLARADRVADALTASRDSAVEGYAWYAEALDVTTAELLRLAEAERQMRAALEELMQAHVAVTRGHPEAEAAFQGTDVPRLMRRAHDVLSAAVDTTAGQQAVTLDPDTCRKCGAAIVWGKTPLGKPCPLDAAPQRRYLAIGGTALRLREVYVTHFITCPFANDFRKPKGTS